MKDNRVATDYDIPRISFKSSFIIMIFAILSSILIPYIVFTLGGSFKIAVIICNVFLMPFAISYVRYFVETKRRYCRGFFRTYMLFGCSFGAIGFFWIYLDTYI